MIASQQTTKPLQRRPLDFRDFAAVAAEVERLHRHGYRRAGNWDLRQMCDHLSAVMEGSLDGFAFSPWSWVWRRLIGPVATRYVVWARSMKQGLQCPDPSFCPARNGAVDESVQRFLRALTRVAQHQGEFHSHPALGYSSPENWRQIHLIHAAHHFSFLLPEGDSAETLKGVESCAKSS